MQKIKKVLSGAAGLLMTGATLMAPAFATGISETFDSMNPSNTVIVVGANANVQDVVSAINVGAALGQHGASVVGGSTSTTTSVSNGVSLDNPGESLYLGDSISKVVDTLTSNDLPILLEKGTFQDDDGVNYNYNQYIEIDPNGANTIEYEQEDTDLDPVVEIAMDASGSNPIMKMKVDFSKKLAFNESASIGNTLKLFGTEFTIGSETTDNSKLVLYKSSQDVSVNKGDTVDVTVGGQTYSIEVVGFDTNNDEVILSVNGQTNSVKEGSSKKINGLQVYAKTVTSWDNGNEGIAILQTGSEKVTLEDGQPVMVGDDETDVDGTKVHITSDPSGVSSIVIDVFATDTDADYIPAGGEFVDPFTNNVRVVFDGITPDLKDSSRDEISFGTSGDYKGYVKFKDVNGNDATIYFAYGSNSASTVSFQDDAKHNIYAYEGASAAEDEILFLAPGKERYTHMVQVKNIKTDSTSGYVEFTDLVTGDTYKSEEGKFDTASDTLNLVVDGKTYTVTLTDATLGSEKVSVDYTADSKTVVYPAMELNNGEYIAFADDISSVSLSPQLILPGGEVDLSGNPSGTYDRTIAGVSYSITYDNSTGKVTAIQLTSKTDPSVVIVEEEDDQNNQNSVVVDVTDGDSGTTQYEVSFKAPAMSASKTWTTSTSNDDLMAYLDYYGTYAERDTSDSSHAKVTVWYPNSQVVAKVAVGSNPQFGGSTVTSGNVEFMPVNNVAKLDTEATADKTTKNLILVGGPYVNSFVSELAESDKTPSIEYWNANLQGKAIIQVIQDAFAPGKVAMVVAGWSKEDTANAADKLVSGGLTSDSVEIQGSVVSDFEFTGNTASEETSM